MTMFDILVLIVFLWLFAGAVRLALRVTWGIAKLIAVILFAAALPVLIGCMLLAGGALILLPFAMVGGALGILKSCT